jgi:phosphinothricin acetyltransferase
MTTPADHDIPTRSTARLTVRSARTDDAEAIREIYNHEVLTSTATMDIAPRSVAEHRRWMSDRSGAHAVLVAVDENDAVVGFASLSPWRSRPAYNTTVEDSVYVAATDRARGVGRLLLGELVQVAEAHGFHAVMARIVSDHIGSIRLHEAIGFETVGVEREVGRKFGRWHDVVLMEKLLGHPR